jgi:hypothetical protein
MASRLGLPLEPFAHPVEVRGAWCPVPLWFLPDELAVELLVTPHVPRGRVWTVDELLALLRIPALTTAGARRVAVAKVAVDSVITDVVPAPPCDGWLPGLEPTA